VCVQIHFGVAVPSNGESVNVPCTSAVMQTNGRTGTPHMDRDSSVGIATRYGLDGPEIKSRLRGARFSAPVQTGPGAHPDSYTMCTGSFPEVKWPERGVDHTPSSAEVKERV
jgi:hypothetical protein